MCKSHYLFGQQRQASKLCPTHKQLCNTAPAIKMQLPACHTATQQLSSSHRRHAHRPHIPLQITQRAQRQLVIAAGEARSANRTKWTQKDQQSAQQGPSSRKQEQYVASISQLTQADGAHDLVSMRLAADTSSSSSTCMDQPSGCERSLWGREQF
jgi:hypothetical protein